MTFSKRFGYQIPSPGQLIREDVPEVVRGGLLAILFHSGLDPRELREIVCKVVRKRPDPGNLSLREMGNEVEFLFYGAQWYKVYDILEAALASVNYEPMRDSMIEDINNLFADESIAWRVADGEIVLHSSDASDAITGSALEALAEADRQTAYHELREAINALSRRPAPDERDAVRRALGAMEALARDITGDRKATLGEILKKHGDLLPPTLREGFSKVWGYSSDVARHVDETRAPTLKEAELVVGLVAAAVTYLSGGG
jgi:hypothetical protein